MDKSKNYLTQENLKDYSNLIKIIIYEENIKLEFI